MKSSKQKKVEEEIQKHVKTYKEALKPLSDKFKQLETAAESFPVKYLKEEDFDTHLLNAASCRRESLKLKRSYISLFTSIKQVYDYYEAYILLEIADEELNDKFDKITINLRESFLAKNKPLGNLKKLKNNIEMEMDYAQDIFRSFMTDESNFRRYVDRLNEEERRSLWKD